MHAYRLGGVINALRIHSLPCCTMLLCQAQSLAPGRLWSGARNTLPGLCGIRQRDRACVFSAGRVPAAPQLHTCTVRLSLDAGLLLGGGRSPAICSPDLCQPEIPAFTQLWQSSPSFPLTGKDHPIPEVRGAWPAVRRRDSRGITGGALLSLQSAFPSGASA